MESTRRKWRGRRKEGTGFDLRVGWGGVREGGRECWIPLRRESGQVLGSDQVLEEREQVSNKSVVSKIQAASGSHTRSWSGQALSSSEASPVWLLSGQHGCFIPTLDQSLPLLPLYHSGHSE